MKLEPSARAALAAVLDHDLAALARLTAQLETYVPRLGDPGCGFADLTAAGYLLHNLYNALENTFEQISRTFENHVTIPERWHRELLEKMFLAIPGIRPAVLPGGLARLLNDLRGFRHLFRHGYDFDLDASRLGPLARQWLDGWPAVRIALRTFRDQLLPATDASEASRPEPR